MGVGEEGVLEGRCWEAASVFGAFCAVSVSSLLGRHIAAMSLSLRLIPGGLHATVDPAGSIQEGLGVGIWVGDRLAGPAAAKRCLRCSERLGHAQPKAPIPKRHAVCGCVPVWKGGAFLGETEKGAPQWGHQGRQGWGTPRAGLASF